MALDASDCSCVERKSTTQCARMRLGAFLSFSCSQARIPDFWKLVDRPLVSFKGEEAEQTVIRNYISRESP